MAGTTFEQQADESFEVTTADDENYDGGDLAAEQVDGGGLSLREALALANGDPTTANTITFAPDLAGATLFLTSGQQLSIITGGITINGDIDGDGSADVTISADSAAGADDAASRVFLIDGPGTIAATLNGLVIRDGRTSGNEAGGGIFVGDDDALTLTNSMVSNNSSSFRGGGIYGGATITLVNSAVSGNSAHLNGGGMMGPNGATITLVDSVVSGNEAGDDGGGIYAGFDAILTLTNTTISDNRGLDRDARGGGILGLPNSVITLTNATVVGNSAGAGGGISGIYSAITLINSTVTGNRADAGGGIYNSGVSPVTTLTNSIVAGNHAVFDGDDLHGSSARSDLVLTGSNIIGSAPADFDAVGVWTQIDGNSQAALETVFARVDLGGPNHIPFAELADNGGPVPTVAIRRGGIAHDTGVDAVLPADTQDLDQDGNDTESLPVDARGFDRAHGPGIDIGAFEIQNSAPVLAHPIPDQSSPEGMPVLFQVAADTFTDLDNQSLTYAATLVGGAPLPAWLIFDGGGLRPSPARRRRTSSAPSTSGSPRVTASFP